MGGREPDDVAGDADLGAKLRDKNEGFYEINRKHIKLRGERLENDGNYRTLLNRKTFTRGWQPNWSEEVYEVRDVNFDKVTNTRGKESMTKQTLPIERYTEVGVPRQIEQGGHSELRNRSRTILHPFAVWFRNGREGVTMHLGQAATLLKTQRGFNENITLARVNMKAPIANFFRLFPEWFEVANAEVRVKPA